MPGTVLDLFDHQQYCAFHGHEPPEAWHEARPADIRRAFQDQHPHLMFLSAPCKGFSGLLSEASSKGAKYQALNALTLRGVWLVLEAYKDDPIELIAFENVPRIRTRGRGLLDQIEALLRAYGYAVAESEHDCGELGGLGQRRVRFLLMCRHVERVPPFLYEPPKRSVRGVGEIIGRLPVPGPNPVLPMHRLPRLQWQTWVRLSVIEAGFDWRSLARLRVERRVLADYALMPLREWHRTAASGRVQCGKYAVADPRPSYTGEYQQLGVKAWSQPASVVTTKMVAGGGAHTVADPRAPGTPFNHVYRVVPWKGVGPAVTGANAGTAAAVADPRPWHLRAGKDVYRTTGEYGVVPWHDAAGAVTAHGQHDNGRWSVADPRDPAVPSMTALPAATDRLVACIQALDGTYHRPFTTLELAALQSLVDPDEVLELDGTSDAGWRDRIGNAVPPDAAQAMASVMAETLLLAWSGETFLLSAQSIWVRPIAVALSVSQPDWER